MLVWLHIVTAGCVGLMSLKLTACSISDNLGGRADFAVSRWLRFKGEEVFFVVESYRLLGVLLLVGLVRSMHARNTAHQYEETVLHARRY